MERDFIGYGDTPPVVTGPDGANLPRRPTLAGVRSNGWRSSSRNTAKRSVGFTSS